MKLKQDFHAQYALLAHDDQIQARAIDFLTGYASSPPRRWSELAAVSDPVTRLSLLAQARIAYTDRARVGQQRGKPGGLWHWIDSGQAHAFLEKQRDCYLHPLGLWPTPPDLTTFPAGTWTIHLPFVLRKPYLSRDDTDFHILDNPVKKEWVFKVPYVAPSQWKGALRAAMRLERGYTTWDQEAEDGQMVRLFGNVKGEENDFSAGRLYFYPTYFDQIDLEVINPHPRDTGAGKQPIYFECVPAGTEGTFTLLYAPLDGADKQQALDDLEAVAAGVKAMMTLYGFGAKTSSGFGVAEEEITGRLLLNCEDPEHEMPKRPREPKVPERVRAFREHYPDEAFQDKPKAWRKKHDATSSERDEYRDARAAYRKYEKRLERFEEELTEWEAIRQKRPSEVTERSFDSFDAMVETMTGLSDALRAKEGDV